MKIEAIRIDDVIKRLNELKKEKGNLFVLNYYPIGERASFSAFSKDEIDLSLVTKDGFWASNDQAFSLVFDDEIEDFEGDQIIEVVTIGI